MPCYFSCSVYCRSPDVTRSPPATHKQKQSQRRTSTLPTTLPFTSTSSTPLFINNSMMKSPPSEIFQQLRLSEQKQNQSQRQKLDGRHTSTKGRHDVSTGGVTKLKLPTRERNVGKTTVRGRKGENLLIHTVCPHSPQSIRHISLPSTQYLVSPG